MSKIIPIEDLKDTGKISAMVHRSDEPIFITNNGHSDMVIMSIEAYEQSVYLHSLATQLDEAEQDFAEGRVSDAFASLDMIQAKYELWGYSV